MTEQMTPEEAKKLLSAIFADTPNPDEIAEGMLETIPDKVEYAEHVLTHSLSDISKALFRLNRLSRLFLISRHDENGLPDIITSNELRMALEPITRLRDDIVEVCGHLIAAYKETKPPEGKLEMRDGERSCENCGNSPCANSVYAYNWDECVSSDFTKHWTPKSQEGGETTNG